METQAKVTTDLTPAPTYGGGIAKFLRDVLSNLEMKLHLARQGWLWYVLGALIFPRGMFYWSRALAPDDPEAVRRLMTGTIVFGVSIMTANSLSDQLIQDRFQGRLKLLITMPMSRAAYAIGVLAFASLQSAVIVALLLAIGFAAGVDFDPTLAFFPIILPMLLTMAGLTLFLSSLAPSAEVGGIITGMVGILPVMISPVFFTMEQAPLLMRWLGWVSPFRYAADGIMKSLSGRTDIWGEFVVLAGFAAAMMAVGFWRMRWRER